MSFDEHNPYRHLVHGWLANVFLSDVERPLLMFNGEQGSGKTTRAAAVMECVNPLKVQNGSPVIGGGLGKLGDDQVKAMNSYLVGYDNLQKVTADQSAFLARLVTGDAVERRALYTDGDSFEVAYKRTGVMTGISVPNFAPDAMERLILLSLMPFAEGQRKARTGLWEHYVDNIPDVLAAVLTDLSTIIRSQHIEVGSVPRMADYYTNLYRLDPVLAAAYLDSFGNAVEEQAEHDPFVQAILNAVKASNGELSYGTLEELRAAVERTMPIEKREYLPQMARSFGARCRESATLLRTVGVTFVDGEKDGRVRRYKLTLTGGSSEPASTGQWDVWGTPRPPVTAA